MMNSGKSSKIIYQDYNTSYDILLSRSQLPSLRVRRLRATALEAFKSVFGLSTRVTRVTRVTSQTARVVLVRMRRRLDLLDYSNPHLTSGYMD